MISRTAADDLEQLHLKAAPGFAAYGRMLEAQDPAAPLFTAAGLEIAAGDMQAMAAAYDRALGPAGAFRSAAPASSKEPRPQNKPGPTL